MSIFCKVMIKEHNVCAACVHVCVCELDRERGDYLVVEVGGRHEQGRANKNNKLRSSLCVYL